MIPYDIDPSLHTAEPEPRLLDDGFSRPHHDGGTAAEKPGESQVAATVEAQLGEKSPF